MNFALILAGGSGTRFWPVSTEQLPKQFLPIGSDRPLLRETAERVVPLIGWERVLVVASAGHARHIRRILPELPGPNLLLEPHARNTAPAIGLGALHVLERDPEGTLVVLPSDHVIRPAGRFRKLLRAACAEARTGALVTLGVVPTRPETGYGYLHADHAMRTIGGWQVFGVLGFAEKPDPPTAQEFLRSGDYFWNSGMFIFQAESIFRAFAFYLPELYDGLNRIRATAKRQRASAIDRLFLRLKSVSIDYGVMEKAPNLHMLPCDCFWSDVGSWAALPEVLVPNGSGNLTQGDVLVLDSSGCVLRSEKRLLACVGLQDLVVVETDHAILVCPRAEAQRVKQVVEELQRRRRIDVL